MKKTVTVLVVIFLYLFIFSCDKTTETDTEAPTVSITYPANNSEFVQGTIITITADANDNKGIKEVKFYIDGTFTSTDENEPYQYEWDTGTTKNTSHTIYAEAYDTSNNTATSDVITLTITGGGTGTVTDIDGNVYQTIQIGDQEWMMENLKVTHYRNGDPIPEVTDNGTWAGLTTGAYCNYNNDAGNGTIYGHLYNWYAVDDSRGIAPEGWHVPTDDGWKELEMYLGMTQAEADDTGLRGTDEGGKLKETGTTHWNSPNTGATNESCFSALPGGYRYSDNGNFYLISKYADFWSSSEYYSTYAWYRLLYYNSSVVLRYHYPKRFGLSVRCARD